MKTILKNVFLSLLLLPLFGGTSAGQDDGLETRIYQMSGNFVSQLQPNRSGSAPAADPFADIEKDESTGRKSGGELLEDCGISFEKGAFAKYDPKTHQLTFKNSSEQHELLEVLLDSIVDNSKKQIRVITEFVEVDHIQFSDCFFKTGPKATPLRCVRKCRNG